MAPKGSLPGSRWRSPRSSEISNEFVKPTTRTSFEWLMYYKASWLLNLHQDEDGNGVASRIKGEPRKQWDALRKELAAFDEIKPKPLPIGSGITDATPTAPATHVLKVGVYDARQQEVQPGFLSILDPTDAKIAASPNPLTTGRRTALAAWLTDAKNPLPARVMANRLWHYHFGRGLVATPSDFGLMGESEGNRALLDWLAATFVEQGWSVKKMHKLLMLSSAYQQSSAFNEAAAQVDPDNKLLWRFRRARLTGEEIRDAVLAVSGQLNRQMFGPSVFPEIPAGFEVRGGWKKNESEEARNRRSVYVFVRRNSRYPLFNAFDMPDTHESCARRAVTTTAPQALSLLNDKIFLRAAQAFAARVLKDCGDDVNAQIVNVYRLALARDPNATERQTALEFLPKQAALLKTGTAEETRAAALADLCHVLFNANEFVYVN